MPIRRIKTNWTSFWSSLSKGQRALLVLCFLVSLLALIQGHHRSKKGRNALLKWGPAFEAVAADEPIYGVGEEGYPTLPVSLMLMAPFHALGPLPGAFAWALVRVALAWWVVWLSWKFVAKRVRDVPAAYQALVLALSLRILHSEIQHANINLWVAALVAASAWQWSWGRPVASGFWMGLGAGLKVTPALGLLFYLRRRSAQGCAGFVAGLATAVCLPMLWLGVGRTLHMTRAWVDQMLLPYLQGRELALRQTEHINQSLLGLLGRWTTDGVAIPSATSWPTEDIRIGVLDLEPGTFQAIHGLAALAVIGFLLWSWKKPSRPGACGMHTLGIFALASLAMLLLSERSWKHHHVVFPMAGAYLASVLWLWKSERSRAYRRIAGMALISAIVLVLGSGEGILGKHGADWAEAYGAYTLATLALFVATGLCLRHAASENLPVSPEDSPSGPARNLC